MGIFNKNDYDSIKKQELKEQLKEQKKMQQPKKPELEKLVSPVDDINNKELILKKDGLEIKCQCNEELFNKVLQLIVHYPQ